MSDLSVDTIVNVVEVSALEGLAELANTAADLSTPMQAAADRWASVPAVFDVFGAEGAPFLLDRAVAATDAFAIAMRTSASTLSDAASYTFAQLHVVRDGLVARAPGILAAYEDAVAAQTAAFDAYGATGAGSSSSYLHPTASKTSFEGIETANRDLVSAENALNALNEEIEQFRLDVLEAEQSVADALGMILDGDKVLGAHGREVRDPQPSWGISEPVYPGGPMVSSPLTEHLGAELSEAVFDRVRWLSSAPPGEAAYWVAQHPDFAGTVGFVEPKRASALWEQLAAQSERGPTGSGDEGWVTGPLAQLFMLAPFAVGNLNGPKAADREEFNKETLKQLLARDDLTKEQRGQLEQLDDLLKGSAGGEQPLTLLSLFLDTDDGSPRATVGFGDVDTADQVTTVTHGINTDMENVTDWGKTASTMQTTLQTELADRGTSATAATVLFLEWDSGDTWGVRNIERADAGAERLAQLQRGFEVSNP
ncbi:MAG: alpha/beta hydrolase, partial [Pseudoclavibacter sp.]